MQHVCVFCGSSPGRGDVYQAAARRFGGLLAARGFGLVYGGGHVGLMGVLADAVLAAGGRVIGVLPRFLVDRELAHRGLSELVVVDTMHQRKQIMADRAEAFVALPGGFGTADELCEILTWSQLHLHTRPIGLLNVAGYFDAFLAWLDHGVREELLRPQDRAALLVDDDPVRLLDLLTGSLPAGSPTRPLPAADVR
jgi:uncharacterized protein (TIGR00730 family)